MKILFDTHAFLWWDAEPLRVSVEARAACEHPANSLHLSIASIWELQIKIQLGKLVLRAPLETILADQRRRGLRLQPIEATDIFSLAELPSIHRDPFDRLLIAQARRGSFYLMTHDPEIARYDVPILW